MKPVLVRPEVAQMYNDMSNYKVFVPDFILYIVWLLWIMETDYYFSSSKVQINENHIEKTGGHYWLFRPRLCNC